MIFSICAKLLGVFLVLVLILRIPSFPNLSSLSIASSDAAATSSSFFFHHHRANKNDADQVSSSFPKGKTRGVDSSSKVWTEGETMIALASSAFDRDLYRTLLVEPYRSQYPCQPRGIHLSQFSDVSNNKEEGDENDYNDNKDGISDNDDDDDDDDNNVDSADNDDYRVSVTVSFLLPSRKSSSTAAAACGSAMAAVVYGRDGETKPEGLQLSQAPFPIQFNYTSLLSLGRYTSDYIHHITIPHLKAGMQRYWYRILVLDQDEDENEESIAAALLLQSAAAAATATTTTTTTSRRLASSLQAAARLRAVQAAAAAASAADTEKEDENHHHPEVLGMTQDYHFWTPPLPGRPTTLALVGDLGQTVNSTKTMAHILQASLDPRGGGGGRGRNGTTVPQVAISNLLIAGDLSYADSDPHRWTSWLYLMEPLLRTTLLSTAPGNHEIETDIRNGREFVPYEHYFRNPNRIDFTAKTLAPSTSDGDSSSSSSLAAAEDYNFGNFFYSYQHGLARIIVLNSYSDTTVGSVQYTWLVEELKRHARTRQGDNNSGSSSTASSSSSSTKKKKHMQPPWLIVSFHSPLYTTFLGHVHETQARRMKTAMEPLFVQYGVNLVISGHDHGYMRTHSIRPTDISNSTTSTATKGTYDDVGDDSNDYDDSMDNAEIDPTGLSPIYLTLGAAGNREHHAPGYRNPQEKEEWVVIRDICDYGYGHLHLKNATHARLRWIRDHVVPDNMTISDDVWIVNRHHSLLRE
jgi:Calcineurin-like phosphoesterase/Iron/zinc purple acid phosphatase-like protein C